MFYLTALLSILIKYHNLYLLGYVEKQGIVYVSTPPPKKYQRIVTRRFCEAKAERQLTCERSEPIQVSGANLS